MRSGRGFARSHRSGEVGQESSGHRGQKLSQCREVRGLARSQSHRSGEVAEGCGQATQVWRVARSVMGLVRSRRSGEVREGLNRVTKVRLQSGQVTEVIYCHRAEQ